MFKVIAIAASMSLGAMPAMANQAQDNALSFILGLVIGNASKGHPVARPEPRPAPQPVYRPRPEPQYCVGKQWVRGQRVWVPETSKRWVRSHIKRNGTWVQGHWESRGGYWTQTAGYYRTVKFRCN